MQVKICNLVKTKQVINFDDDLAVIYIEAKEVSLLYINHVRTKISVQAMLDFKANFMVKLNQINFMIMISQVVMEQH